MFLGTHSARLDEKNRMILPARFRTEFESGLVLTRGQERCLYVFRREDFARMAESICAAPLTNKQARDYLRVFLSGASSEEMDRQFRLTLPAPLRNYARLDRDLVLIGAGSRLELWDARLWEVYLEQQESAFAEIAEEVIPGL